MGFSVDPRFYRFTGPLSAAELAEGVGGVVFGDPARSVSTVAEISAAAADALTFHDAKTPVPGHAAGIVFVGQDADLSPHPGGTAYIRHAHPRAAFAHAATRLIRERDIGDQAMAVDAFVETGARIGPGVVIGAGAAIGARTLIGANTVIGPGVAIGRDCRIGANAVLTCALIGDAVTVGPGAMIGQAGFGVTHGGAGLVDLPHFGRVIIQDGATIGANCTIDRGMLRDTVLGEQVKLDNLCHIAHNVVVGRQVRMAAFAGISGSTTIGDRSLLAGRVGVVDHAAIGADTILAAGSAVLQDVPAGQVWCGYPAKPRMQWLREVAWLAKASRTGAARKRDGDQS